MKKDESTKENLIQQALEGAAAEDVDRYSNAAEAYLRAYNKAGVRSLKSIADSSVNPEYAETNLKQQAGFSAEVRAAARDTAESIIQGKNGTRTVRTDDVTAQSDYHGHAIGGTNDQLYDLAEVDSRGIYVDGTARQLKFVGGTPKECISKLLGRKFDKYRAAGVPIEIPGDFYDDAVNDLNIRAEKLQHQISAAEATGDSEKLNSLKSELQRIESTRDSLRKSSVTNEEALEARKHPIISTTKDVMKTAHRAGVAQAEIGAIIAGAIAAVQNAVACLKGEKTPEEALLDVAKKTGVSAAASYTIAFSGTTINALLKNSENAYVKGLGRTNLAASLASTSVRIASLVKKRFDGDLSTEELFQEIVKFGAGDVGAAMYTSLTMAAVKGTTSQVVKIAAGMAGSTLGYTAAMYVYNEIRKSQGALKAETERRILIEAHCEEIVQMLCRYREEMESATEKYLNRYYSEIRSGFQALDQAILSADSNGFIRGNVTIQRVLGRETQFENQTEFDELMESDEDFKL